MHDKQNQTTHKSIRGVTIIELIIALSLAAILASSLYYFWNYLNRHTLTHTQNAIFTTETNRIVNSIGSQIRSAKSILSCDISSIKFITKFGDTLFYMFDGDSLLRNDIPLALISQGAQVLDFEIKNLNENDYRTAEHSLLEFTLTMRNFYGDTSTVALTVRAPKLVVEYDSW